MKNPVRRISLSLLLGSAGVALIWLGVLHRKAADVGLGAPRPMNNARQGGVQPPTTRLALDSQAAEVRHPVPSTDQVGQPGGPHLGAFREFSSWVDAYDAAEGPVARGALLAQGEKLASIRRNILRDLIQADPKRALAFAVPDQLRSRLPEVIQRQLEQRISGKGDFRVTITCTFGQKKHEDEVSRQATIGNRTYAAFVYGQRLHQVSQNSISLQGIAIDQSLAVQDDAELPGPTAGDTGGGTGYNQPPPTADSSYTQGTKRLLFMRVAFPDDPSEPMTATAASELMDQVNRIYVDYSYNTTAIISDFTPLLILPQAKAAYGGQSVLTFQADARAAALAAGYDTDNYDFDIVRNNPIPGPNFAFAGQASIGGKGLVLQNSLLYVAVHELGHNYGLWHANFWNASGDSITGPGSTAEYGNTFDTMGSQIPDPASYEFNAEFKYHLQWLPSSFVQPVTNSGVYRIFAYDVPNLIGGQKYAIRVKKDYAREYWAEFRKKLVGNPWTQSGVILNWTPFGNFAGDSLNGTTLLDTTPGTPSSNSGKDDAPVVIGRTFSDVAAGIHLTPLAKGTIGPDNWIDVQVNLGDFPGNAAPTLAVALDQTSVAPDTPVNFTATAADGDGDTLSYYWDFGDLTFGTNAATASKSWTSAGEYVVRCTVSDMKGGVASRNLVVTVGSPNTFRVSGRVTDSGGQPVEGVRVHNGLSDTAYHGAYTDSDGYYTLANLPAGGYTLSAVKYGYTLAAGGWSNPVTVGPSLSGQDWTATQGPVLSVAASDPAAAETGTDPGVFTLTRSGSLASALTVRFNLSGTATYSTDYTLSPAPTVGSSFQLVMPAGAASMNIVLTPLIDSAVEGPETATLTLFDDPAYTLGSSAEATVIIADSQSPGTPAVTVTAPDDLSTESGSDTGAFQFTRSGSVASDLTVNYNVTGTATNGVDYSPLSGTVVIPAGQASAWVSFNAVDDVLVEGDESVIVTILPNASYNVGTPSSATVTIVDNDPSKVTIIATDDTAVEGSSDTGTFTITRVGNLAADLIVNYGLTGTASNGADYVTLPGTVTILAGQVSASFTVTPVDDSIVEGTETVVATVLSNPGYNIGNPGTATISIIDDDSPGITLAATDPNASEAGPDTGTFTFTRTGSTADPITVYFNVSGSATNGADYLSVGNSIVIPAGAATASLTITPIDDSIKEGTETVVVTLAPSPTSSYSVTTTSPQTVNIVDNDGGGSVGVSWSSSASSGSEDQGFPTFTINLSAASPVTVKVNYSISNGTATSPADYVYDPPSTVTFFPGQVSQTIEPFRVIDDSVVEADETIILTLSPVLNCVLDASNTVHTYTILDNDGGSGTITVTATDAQASKTGPDTGTFRILRSGATSRDLTVNFQVTGTASSPSDYLPIGNSVVIPAGQNHVDVVVTPVADTTPEPAESVIVTLTSASGASRGTPKSATIWIADGPPLVSVVASKPNASETGPVNGEFTFTRSGLTASALVVPFSVAGTAAAGLDYVTLPASVTIPVGASSVTLAVTPIADTLAEGDESVTLTVTPNAAKYNIGTGTAMVAIADSPIDAWRHAKFGASANNPAIAGDFSDPDGDGLNNLLEYAFGTDPLTPNLAPALAFDGPDLVIIYQRNLLATDVILHLKSTTDFATWVDAGQSEQILSDNGIIRVIRAQLPDSGASRMFYRFEATRTTP